MSPTPANSMRQNQGLWTRAVTMSVALVFVAFAASEARGQQASVNNSPHNLSAGGPGAIRATSEQEVCIFCHAPHNASPIQPAWNRNMPVNAYTVYSSGSLDAAPGQPTGPSKLCLSCHDGSIAVGSVLSRQQPIAMAGGITTIPAGTSNVGTDLSDDHPISFRYDAALASQDVKLRQPDTLPRSVKLDVRGEMQCTTCHDAHDNSKGSFLVMENNASQLCLTCHQVGRTTIAAHESCSSCHQQHSAPSGALLLRGVTATATCAACHGGAPLPAAPGEDAPPRVLAGPDVVVDLNKVSRHGDPSGGAVPSSPVRGRIDERDAREVHCADCHEPHTMQPGTAAAPMVPPSLGEVSGVNASGAAVPRAQFGYEVCYKCHGDQNAIQPRVTRVITQNNARLEFSISAVSSHPLEAAGKNPDVPSLRPGLTPASIIACTDCHQSETGRDAGGGGANGPHGSNLMPLLIAPYETSDATSESAMAYALCYRCHDRQSILTDQSFVGHQKHIVEQRTPCSACHDSHGISSAQGNSINNNRLMNFDTTIVQADPETGRLEYRSLGSRAGECYLSCHGVPHSPKSYPTNLDPGPPANPEPAPGPAPAPGPTLQRLQPPGGSVSPSNPGSGTNPPARRPKTGAKPGTGGSTR